MIINIDLDQETYYVKILLINGDMSEWDTVCRTINDISRRARKDGNTISLPWSSFLQISTQVYYLLKYKFPSTVTYNDNARKELQIAKTRGFSNIASLPILSSDEISEKLKNSGFSRNLTSHQLRNVTKIARLFSAATFSVPGAGKTTEALAYYEINKLSDTLLLVVAPKNAFPAWDEQLSICLPMQPGFVRLVGGSENIENALLKKPKFAIISYQQFVNVKDQISAFLSTCNVFMFLDESHRIKAGNGKITADSITSIASLPRRKLIMTGTPLPQSVEDLVPQMQFLYPETIFDKKNIKNQISEIYVRTTKGELALPSVERTKTILHFTELQKTFYDLMKSTISQQMLGINRENRNNLKKIGKSIVRLMQYTSNPLLLTKELTIDFPNEFKQILLSEKSVKIEYVCLRARQLASENKKVIIWSGFVENVELISSLLVDLGADFIHGGVELGSEEDSKTREGKIKRFHEDPKSMVLVANPAAASEGISLHKICHNAIYVDRNFNAAQYLQSEDRIHRLGLQSDIVTNIEIIEIDQSIDSLVHQRLVEKTDRMANVLNDKSLNIEIENIIEIDDIEESGISKRDINEFLDFLRV